MTRNEALDGFLRTLRARGYAPGTLRGYSDHLAPLFAWAGVAGTDDISILTPDRLRAFQAHLARTDQSPTGQRRRMLAIGRFFRWLEDSGGLFSDPAARLDLPRRKPPPIGLVLTRGEVERVMAVPDPGTPTGLRDRAVLELAYGSGLRKGELIGLDLADLDLERRLITIRQTKGLKDRVVPATRSARDWVGRYLRQGRPELQGEPPSAALLLATRRPAAGPGRRLSSARLHGLLGEIGRKAGVGANLTSHALRRTCATHLLDAGLDVSLIAALLGHEDPATTVRHYTRLSSAALRKVHAASHPAECDPDRWTLPD